MRLFFAYWPSQKTVDEITPWVQQAHALYGGRMMRPDTLHMTLAFLGAAGAEQAQALVDACAAWTLPTGDMVLSEPGRFKKPGVVWLGPDSSAPGEPAWLYAAHERLWSLLEPFGWQRPESGFRPHVSLLRNAGPGELSALRRPDVPWAPDRCVLVGSHPTPSGSRYTVLAELKLEAGAVP